MKLNPTKQKLLSIVQIFLIIATTYLQAQTTNEIDRHRVTLPNGWKLSPVGKMLPLGDLPLNMAIAPSKKIAAITNNGYGVQSIQLIDLEKQVILDSIVIGKSWLGLIFSADGKYLYASGGNDNIIIRYGVANNHLTIHDTITIGKPWPVKISITGLALDDAKNKLYAVTKENNALYVIDIISKKILSQLALGGEGYTCLLSPDHKILYISCWGCDKVILFDTDQQKISSSIEVGDNPNDMCVTRNGQYLFVANANDNSVSVIDTKQRKVIETLNTALYPNAPSGSTPNSVALSEDDKKLFIANADNNCLSVFDVSIPGSGKSKGFIPTAWYPTCVRIANGKVLVTSGKGLSSMANPHGPSPYDKGGEVVYQKGGKQQKIKVQYIGGLFKGILSILNIPDEPQMALYSKAVYENTPYTKNKETISEGDEANPVPKKIGDKSPIKYVFYIIKENRTYDQVLGDIPEGNGDPGLVLFGQKITPNQHALTREFVLLDNFYVDGEVSADGHNWTMGAYATDYMEKHWPTSYSGRGGNYDGEGERKISANKNYLWDNCQKAGVSFRSYGEFASGSIPNIPVLKDHLCSYFTPWDQSVFDTIRFGQWKRDFDSLLAAGALPKFNTVRFINDHTQGLSLGKRTPLAQVADNDLAVGMFVDYLSHSKVWKESVVFIVEDDAQSGPDHVDAHRSTAYLAGGYVKQGFVDHTPYSTSSLLRTMELILGVPPMSQYDAAAVPLWRCFSNSPGHPPFNVKPCQVNLDDKNLAKNEFQLKSERFDFTKEDMVSDAEFNEVIWKAVKGIDSPCPPSVHAAFFMAGSEEDE